MTKKKKKLTKTEKREMIRQKHNALARIKEAKKRKKKASNK